MRKVLRKDASRSVLVRTADSWHRSGQRYCGLNLENESITQALVSLLVEQRLLLEFSKRVADEAITTLFRTGEIFRLYQRWFQSPIPPRGMNLQLPMHPAMRRVVDKPTDSPDPAVYR
jgi:hypothetical protein